VQLICDLLINSPSNRDLERKYRLRPLLWYFKMIAHDVTAYTLLNPERFWRLLFGSPKQSSLPECAASVSECVSGLMDNLVRIIPLQQSAVS
jgi:hypothetical protein